MISSTACFFSSSREKYIAFLLCFFILYMITLAENEVKKKCEKICKKSIDNREGRCYYNQAFERRRDARVVELADSLDSGSSAHSGRAGSSPASRTKQNGYPNGVAVFVLCTRQRSCSRQSPTKWVCCEIIKSKISQCIKIRTEIPYFTETEPLLQHIVYLMTGLCLIYQTSDKLWLALMWNMC